MIGSVEHPLFQRKDNKRFSHPERDFRLVYPFCSKRLATTRILFSCSSQDTSVMCYRLCSSCGRPKWSSCYALVCNLHKICFYMVVPKGHLCFGLWRGAPRPLEAGGRGAARLYILWTSDGGVFSVVIFVKASFLKNRLGSQRSHSFWRFVSRDIRKLFNRVCLVAFAQWKRP
jgi:hypothetical protein